jgi:trans-aconitate 2-methyltransferase
MTGERYLYGDTDLAADRLAIVARVFESTTKRFLERYGLREAALSVDLGCGPGYSTRLIHEVLRPARTLGLDQSEAYVARATAGAPEGVAFAVHDAREVPFPGSPADLVYCRLLLAHLNRPPDVVARWATQVRPGGALLLDELEDISSEDPAFTRYLDFAHAVVASEGSTLYAGPVLDAAGAPTGTEVVANDVIAFRADPRDLARICGLNLTVLRTGGQLPAEDRELDALAAELAAIAAGERSPSSVWRVRQIALRRV